MSSPGSTPSRSLVAPMFFLERNSKWLTEKPYNLQFYPKHDFPATNLGSREHMVHVQDIKDRQEPVGLDTEGFQLCSMETDMKYEDFAISSKIEEVYCRELEEHCRQLFAANCVRVLDYQLRRRRADWPPEGAKARLPSSPQPSIMTHVDSTPGASSKIIRELYSEDAESILRSRYMIVTIWRALKLPVEDWPLAVCDSTSVNQADLVESDVVYPNYVAENRLLHFHEDQKWYWVPQLTEDEVIMFKATDSNDPTAGTPHGSFPLPNSQHPTPRRESIDVRLLVMFADVCYDKS